MHTLGLYLQKKKTARSRLVGRAPLEPTKKRVDDAILNNEALRRDAGLTGVLHAPNHTPLHGGIEIGIIQDNEGIAAAEFHRALLQCLTRLGSDRRHRPFAAGQRNPSDPAISDDLRRLFVTYEDVGPRPHRSAGIEKELFESLRALRHIRRMLADDGVTQHEIRSGDPRQLVVRVVPRLDAEKHAKWRVL